MKELLLLFLGSALFSLTLHYLLRRHRSRPAARRPAPLTPPDHQAFLYVLASLVHPASSISCQVRLADLLEVRPERGRRSAFRYIADHHLDFLITDSTTGRLICGIALDERSLPSADRLTRDAIVDRLFATQDLPLLRIPRALQHNLAALRESLALLSFPAPPHLPPRSGARGSS